MTLIAIKRDKETVSFASDSRISFGEDGYFDKGIKIFSVPLKIRGLPKTKEEIRNHVYEYEYDYGLAVVGSSTNAYTIKDSIVEILPNIQYLTNLSNFSIYAIGDLVLDVYRKVSHDLTAIMREKGHCEIILGGYCIFSKKIKILRFYHIRNENNIEYQFEEILSQNGMIFFGSGKTLAKEILSKNPSFSSLQIIKKVIISKNEKTVGGPLQYGFFAKNNFQVTGVWEKYIDHAGNSVKVLKYRRGFIVKDDLKKALKPPYLSITYGYMPVELDINEYDELDS